MGYSSLIEHSYKLTVDIEKGYLTGIAVNSGKLILDTIFLFSKSVNPVFLTVSVAYGVVDYLTSDY